MWFAKTKFHREVITFILPKKPLGICVTDIINLGNLLD